MAYNVLGAQGRKADADASIELVDDDGRVWSLETNSTDGTFSIKKDNVSMLSLVTGGVGGFFGLGAPEVVTIAAGVATCSGSFVQLAAESSTTDQLDTITLSTGTPNAGTLLLLTADTGDTITVDDANIDLGGATRALAGPNQFLLLIYNGSSWSEISFAAGDNV